MNQFSSLQLWSDESFVLYAVRGYEAISALFYFDLELDTLGEGLMPANYLHKPLSFQLRSQCYHAIVTQITELGLGCWRFRVEPAVVQLQTTLHSRVYQQKSVLEIVQSLLSDFAINLSRLVKNYESRTYCVQYQESDWSFIERLLAEEGIYYLFLFESNKHSLLLCDKPSTEFYSQPLYHVSEQADGCLLDWVEYFLHGVNHVSAVDDNSRSPQLALQLNHFLKKRSVIGDFEYKCYPGGYQSYQQGEHVLQYRAEFFAQNQQSVLARSCYELKLGINVYRYRHEQAPYLITELWHQAEDLSYRNTLATKTAFYRNKFRAIPAALFRPFILAKPLIAHPQIARVQSTQAESVLNDNFDLLIQCEWDEAKLNLPARVTQLAAGATVQSQFSPRAGDKVLVYFLNGDPERPIVSGSLHDLEQAPLYELQNAGIKMHSSERANAFCFDHLHQTFSWHAAKDFKLRVAGDANYQARDSELAIQEGQVQLEVNGLCEFSASDSIEMKVGSSSITLTPDKIILAADKIQLN